MSLKVEIAEKVATLTLERPERLNAIDRGLRSELRDVWPELDHDDAVAVIVLTGAGTRAFCVGSDLKDAGDEPSDGPLVPFGRELDDHLLATMGISKPIIAAINGYAIGGGLELAMGCDIRIASSTAELGLGEVKIGSIPGAGGTQMLPRLVGLTNAMQMLLTGDRIDAARALDIGLISEVVAPGLLRDRAHEIAAAVAANAPLAVRTVKQLAYEAMDVPASVGMRHERVEWHRIRATADRAEGRAAFREKRPPRYTGS